MEISDHLGQSIREIQDIDFEKIHEEHRKVFADKKKLQNILYYATYKAIKENHLGFNIFNDNDAKPLLNFKLWIISFCIKGFLDGFHVFHVSSTF